MFLRWQQFFQLIIRRQWPWRSLEGGWHQQPQGRSSKRSTWMDSGSTLDYSPGSLWSLHERPELPWTHATGDVKAQQNMLATLRPTRYWRWWPSLTKIRKHKVHSSSSCDTTWGGYCSYIYTHTHTFIRATRDGLWELHLSSLDALCANTSFLMTSRSMQG